MRGRPLALLCFAAVIFLSVRGAVRGSGRDKALLQVQEYLTETAETGNTLTFAGTVAEVCAVSEGIRLSVNHISIYTKDNSNGSLSSDLKLIMTIETDSYLPGDRIYVTGTYQELTAAGNPGQFDFAEYYFARNTVGWITGAEVLSVSEGSISLPRVLARFRSLLRYSYLQILEEKAARTVSAISLGEKSFMEKEWKQIYQEGGIAHIISISGLHISLIGMCIYRILRRIGLPFALASVPSAVAVVLYALMSGSGISAMRACVMFVIWLGAQIVGRKYDMLTAAAVAAAVILTGNDRAASQSSFLLSFGAILSMAILLPRLQEANPFRTAFPDGGERRQNITRKARKHGGNIIKNIACSAWDLLCGGAGVWLGTLPITLWFFYQTVPWSLLVNLAVVPLMSALMAFGMISCLVGLFSVSAGTFLAAPVYYLLGLFEGLCSLEQKLPCPVWIVGRPELWKIVVYYVLLMAAACSVRILRNFSGNLCVVGRIAGVPALLWLGAAALGTGLLGSNSYKELTVTCLDVGQGDGALLQIPDGITCLIDGGSTSESSVWEYRISQTIKYYGISTIDYVFLSHADSDHISGIQEYLEDYLPGFAGKNAHGITLKNLVLPPTADEEDFAELIRLAGMNGITVLRMEAGAVIQNTSTGAGSIISGTGKKQDVSWSLSCLAPSSDHLSGDKNEDSMVLMLQYGAFRMLFTGDLENDAERVLAASDEDLSCDIMKVGHHGSNGASSEQFLSAVNPTFGVISCGENNSYGHPGAEAVERLQEAKVTLYTTMDCGALIIHSDGSRFSIYGYRDTSAYPEES